MRMVAAPAAAAAAAALTRALCTCVHFVDCVVCSTVTVGAQTHSRSAQHVSFYGKTGAALVNDSHRMASGQGPAAFTLVTFLL
jgi:hypothetical protein